MAAKYRLELAAWKQTIICSLGGAGRHRVKQAGLVSLMQNKNYCCAEFVGSCKSHRSMRLAAVCIRPADPSNPPKIHCSLCWHQWPATKCLLKNGQPVSGGPLPATSVWPQKVVGRGWLLQTICGLSRTDTQGPWVEQADLTSLMQNWPWVVRVHCEQDGTCLQTDPEESPTKEQWQLSL